eukprot:CAMPEP_0172067726 /NCGR_PEP_ID=MMETSP1043-20130122/11841_1 /TAXON_ID=464988 /ORGANISM="Hemiselmis andersenii, Strain CCMP441" /LENGTH=113 /DNA_ID=CAMNT_0012727957 /DNA_START=34 /DNA_END=372 /DNA_ORIENTATION=+
MEGGYEGEDVMLVVKNADGTTPDLELEAMPLDGSTVGCVKEMVCRGYQSHPHPSQLKLVFSGRLLKDNEQLFEVLGMHDLSHPVIFHVLVRASTDPATPSPSPSPTPSSSGPS